MPIAPQPKLSARRDRAMPLALPKPRPSARQENAPDQCGQYEPIKFKQAPAEAWRNREKARPSRSNARDRSRSPPAAEVRGEDRECHRSRHEVWSTREQTYSEEQGLCTVESHMERFMQVSVSSSSQARPSASSAEEGRAPPAEEERAPSGVSASDRARMEAEGRARAEAQGRMYVGYQDEYLFNHEGDELDEVDKAGLIHHLLGPVWEGPQSSPL